MKEADEKFLKVFHNNLVGMILTDKDHFITDVNDYLLNLAELKREEVIGRNGIQLGLMNEGFANAMWQQLAEKGSIFNIELSYTTRTHKTITGLFSIERREINGELNWLTTVIDISKKKKADDKISESELRFRTLTSTAPVGIFETDEKGKTIYVNETWLEYSGLSFEEAMGDAWMELIHPDDRDFQVNTWYTKTEKAEISHSEYRIIDKKGKLRWINGKAVPLIDKNEKITGYIGTITDVTERKLAMESLVQTHQRMDTLVNTIDGIVWEADVPGFNFTFVSKKAEQILGYTVEEWLAEQDFWANHIHPDDKAWAVEYCLKATKEKRKHDFEYRMIAKDGSILWLRDIVSVITESGQPVQLRGIMVNITERKKAEEEMGYNASLLENVTDAILSLDTERRIMSWNKASEYMYGFTKEEVLGRRIPEIVIFEFPGTNNEAVFNEVIEKGNWKGEVCFIHPKNGQPIIVLGNINLLKNTEGKITGFIATSKDITERKQVENALNERTEQLRELSTHLQEVREEERTNIAREIHDELGQQLTGLKMDITWLQKRVKLDDPIIKTKFSDSIKLIDASVKTIRRIVTELRPSIIDDLGLNAAIEWHVEDFGKKLGIIINYHNNFNDEHIRPAISIGLFRILQESLTNIAKHAQAKNVAIHIEQVNDAIYLFVQDDGVGFDTGIKQIDKTFGLLGIKERAHKMNGDCRISSKPGEGTKIEVHIPLK